MLAIWRRRRKLGNRATRVLNHQMVFLLTRSQQNLNLSAPELPYFSNIHLSFTTPFCYDSSRAGAHFFFTAKLFAVHWV
jgi:hypothetical protein